MPRFARDYWSGLGWYTLLALALGGTYTTGILLVAENVPVERRGRAMGMYLAGHSLGLALALVLTGAAIPRGGYVLAFWLLASGPVVGGVLAWLAVRSTANVVTPRAGGQRFGGEVLKNRPAMLVIAGYTFHSWELLGMWAWTPAFLAACFVAAGSELTRGAGLGAYMTSLFHVTGMIASLLAGVFADRFGRTPVILVMATVSAVVLARVRLADRDVAGPRPRRWAPLRIRRAGRLSDLLDRDHRGRGARLSRLGAGAAFPARLRRGGDGAAAVWRDPRLVRSHESRRVGVGVREPRRSRGREPSRRPCCCTGCRKRRPCIGAVSRAAAAVSAPAR